MKKANRLFAFMAAPESFSVPAGISAGTLSCARRILS